MRKLIATFILVTIAVVTKAQTAPGTVYIGGSISYTKTKLDDKANTSINGTTQQQTYLAPTFGMFINSHWAIGVSPTYSASTYEGYVSPLGVTTISKTKFLGAGVEVGYYLMLGYKFAFSPKITGTYLSLISGKYLKHAHQINGVFRPNFSFFPSRKIELSLSVANISWTKESDTAIDNGSIPGPKTTNSNFIINAGETMPTVGVVYHFTK